MGILQNLWEDKLKVKFIKNPNEFTGVPITDDNSDITIKQINNVDEIRKGMIT